MENKTIWMILIVVVLVIILGTLAFMLNSKPNINTNPSTANSNPAISNPSNPSQENTETYQVSISNFAFSPSSITIKKGDTVIWTNMDSALHTIISDSGNELSSSSLSNGASYSHTFSTAGTYNYHCSIHTTMKGMIIVQ